MTLGVPQLKRRKLHIEVGQRFGSAIVVKECHMPDKPNGFRGDRAAEMLCDCGSTFVTKIYRLISGATKTCGHGWAKPSGKPQAECSVHGCERRTSEPVGRCKSHRGWRNGVEPLKRRAPTNAPLEDKLFSNIEVGDCWLWTASRDRAGYGKVTRSGRSMNSHRVMYEFLVGEIPAGLQLDHLCRNRACCNPDHLEPVTQAENIRRGVGAVRRKIQAQAKRA